MKNGRIVYRVRNWKEYNRSLINRGNITFWFDNDSIRGWYHENGISKNGRPFLYSEISVQCCLMLRLLFHLPLRATQGFVEGMLHLLGLPLTVPNYSTLCRRSGALGVDLERLASSDPVAIVVDSSGLKVFGESEWKVRIHGKAKRRTWRKVHLSVDADSHEIIAVTLTTHKVHDCQEMPRLLPKDQPISVVYADGAYDNRRSFDAIVACGARPVIPPRSGAALAKKPSVGMLSRNKIIRDKWRLGEKGWKKSSGYHRRSLAETAVYRYKNAFGERLHARIPPNQIGEAQLRAKILNRMTHCGMPRSVKVELRTAD